MNPSIQCIFERILAGVLAVAFFAGVLAGVTALAAYCQKRWPSEPKSLNPLHDKILGWFMGITCGGFFGGLALWGCYHVGKDILRAFGICHLQ